MNKNQGIIDGKLVLDYQSGNDEALVKLVARCHKLFCEKAFWIVKDADVAKDIAQDSWKIIMRKIDTLKTPNSFRSWGMRIVYTKSLDWIKANNRTREELTLYKYGQDKIDEEKVDNKELKNALAIAIESLPKDLHHVIKLFYVEDYSLKEIGAILNISIGTAKSRLFHAREKLKLTLKNRNYEN